MTQHAPLRETTDTHTLGQKNIAPLFQYQNKHSKRIMVHANFIFPKRHIYWLFVSVFTLKISRTQITRQSLKVSTPPKSTEQNAMSVIIKIVKNSLLKKTKKNVHLNKKNNSFSIQNSLLYLSIFLGFDAIVRLVSHLLPVFSSVILVLLGCAHALQLQHLWPWPGAASPAD